MSNLIVKTIVLASLLIVALFLVAAMAKAGMFIDPLYTYELNQQK